MCDPTYLFAHTHTRTLAIVFEIWAIKSGENLNALVGRITPPLEVRVVAAYCAKHIVDPFFRVCVCMCRDTHAIKLYKLRDHKLPGLWSRIHVQPNARKTGGGGLKRNAHMRQVSGQYFIICCFAHCEQYAAALDAAIVRQLTVPNCTMCPRVPSRGQRCPAPKTGGANARQLSAIAWARCCLRPERETVLMSSSICSTSKDRVERDATHILANALTSRLYYEVVKIQWAPVV